MKSFIKILVIIPFCSMTAAQLPFFLQRFMPKIAGYSLLSPFASPSVNSPSYSSPPPSFGSTSFGSPNFGSSSISSSNFGSPSFGTSNFGSPSFGSLNGLGSLPLPSSSYGAASYPPPNIGSPPFSSPTSFSSPNSFSSPSSFSSPNSFSSPSFFSPSSFGSSNFGSFSPFASASFNSPSFGPKLAPGSLASSSLVDFDSVNSFDGGFQHSDLLDDYPGFTNANFAKDLNFAGSQALKFHAPAALDSDDFSFKKRSGDSN